MQHGYEKRLLGSPYKSPIKIISPMTTPTKENYLDRYIPSRANAKWKNPSSYTPSRCLFAAASSSRDKEPSPSNQTPDSAYPQSSDPTRLPSGECSGRDVSVPPEEVTQTNLLSAIVHNELIDAAEGGTLPYGSREVKGDHPVLAARENSNIFSFKLPNDHPCKMQTNTFTLSPVSDKSQRLLQCPQKHSRWIPRMPYKVLDAPELQDDFYLNLVDWSTQNMLVVGLGTCVYLWNALTSQVTRLCNSSDLMDTISSVAWSKRGNHVAVATRRGHVHIWDASTTQCLRQMEGHLARVGALAWNQDLLASGSRDRLILLRDVRAASTSGGGSSQLSQKPASRETTVPLSGHQLMETETTAAPGPTISRDLLSTTTRESVSASFFKPSSRTTAYPITDSGNGCVRVLKDHLQEVCGLKWSPDNQYLASGGNDNRLLVWSQHARSYSSPVLTYKEHLAAVKAIAWSPHQHGLLASGGGTADRRIRFWNTLTGQALCNVETESQVCNLAWSMHSNELVSTHGYTQNQILVWRYPSLSQLAKLTGHTYRVLYLAVSPDGENVVTGAGDETLRFWNVFAKSKCQKQSSSLNLFEATR